MITPDDINDEDIEFGFSLEDLGDDIIDLHQGGERESLKWIADGAGTLKEAITMIRGFADHLESLAGNGYELVTEVDNGFISYRKTSV